MPRTPPRACSRPCRAARPRAKRASRTGRTPIRGKPRLDLINAGPGQPLATRALLPWADPDVDAYAHLVDAAGGRACAGREPERAVAVDASRRRERAARLGGLRIRRPGRGG